MFETALAILTGLYALAGVVLSAAARRGGARPSRGEREGAVPFVSVLVAARDEERMLPGCLAALQEQTYPSDRYEIIVSDDHSSDATSEVAQRYGVRSVRLNDGDGGKAGALHAAFEISRGDILAVTDADCRPPADWLAAMTAQFEDDRRGVVCGVTSVSGDSVLARVQALDWTLLLTVASGFSALGLPLTAMGNNMAFRREAYTAVGGYPALPRSVTEDYALFRAVDRQTGWSVHLLAAGRLKNVTTPLTSLRDVFAQRKRWARGGLRADPWVYLFYAAVVGAHAAIAAAFLVTPAAGLAALAAKVGTDSLVIASAGIRVRLWTVFPVFEGYFFAYVLALPIVLLLAPAVEWRGRRW